MTNIIDEVKEEKSITRHYYGDVVRFLFIVAAIIMLVTLPFLNRNLPIPLFGSILAILAFGTFAGFTNPVQKNTAIINACVSIVALIIFEYYAAQTYFEFSYGNLMFIVNQILAIIFLFALYYSTKTLRAMLVRRK